MLAWIGLGLAGVAALAATVGWARAGRGAAAEKQRADRLAAELAVNRQELEGARERETGQREQIARLGATAEQLNRQMDELRRLLERAGAETEQSRRDANATRIELAELRTRLSQEQSNAVLLENQFKVLADRILKENAKEFAEQNQSRLTNLLMPVGEALKKLGDETQAMESKRDAAYGAVLSEIRNLQQAHGDLRRETSQLVQALKAPKTRGSWGELQLRKCIEFAGMVEHCTFEKEVHIAGTAEREDAQRPDVVVQLPNRRCIVVDAKTPLEAFLEAMATEDEAQKAEKLRLHALQVRKHLEQLQKKRYWERLEHAADFVVCFLPSEVLFSAALEADPSLIEYGVKDNVVLATPTTLISLLRAVAMGWQQSRLTENARSIQETGLALYRKLGKAHEHLTGVGKGIRNAGRAYDELVGILEGRGGVFSQARKLRELGVGESDLEAVDVLSLETRELRADDWGAGSGELQLAAMSEETERRG